MARSTAFFVLLLFCLPLAQVVKAFSVQKKTSCKTAVLNGYDIDNPSFFGMGGFFAFKDGCTAKIIDVSSNQVVYELDLGGVGIDTGSVYSLLTFYRNFTASDNKWSAIYSDISIKTSPSQYTAGIVSDKKLQILSTTATTYASLDMDGGNLYVVVDEGDRIDFYVARNNVKRSAIPYSIDRYSAHMPERHVLWSEYNPAGQSLNERNTPRNIKKLVR